MRWLLCLALLAACTPSLNWREVRSPSGAAVAMFPCKPASHEREVSLAGRPVKLTLLACTANQSTYALALADVSDVSQVGAALRALKTSAWANVRVPDPVATQPLSLKGMTPNAEAAQWQVPGRLPDGRAVQEAGAVFAHASWVFQATVIAPKLDAQATQTFMESLRVGSAS
jgi:hypothetical protein